MTVAELGRRMSSREFTRWQRYAAVEPFGSPRDDLRAGEIAALIANVNRDSRRRPQPFTPGDFFPQIAPLKPPVDAKASWLAWADRHNAAQKRRGKVTKRPR